MIRTFNIPYKKKKIIKKEKKQSVGYNLILLFFLKCNYNFEMFRNNLIITFGSYNFTDLIVLYRHICIYIHTI